MQQSLTCKAYAWVVFLIQYHAAFSEKIVGLLKQAVETAEPPKGGHVRFNCYKKYEA